MDIRKPIPTNGGDWNAKFGDTWKSQTAKVRDKFAGSIEEIRMPVEYPTDVPIIYVKKDQVVDLLAFLKSEAGFEYNFLADITATDEEADPRFEVVYNLLSHASKCRIRVKCRVKDGEEVPTACGLWSAANWQERETFDMFGIKFTGHPDLRRVLMDERWVGYPLRKDYPLRGYQVFTEPMAPKPELLD